MSESLNEIIKIVSPNYFLDESPEIEKYSVDGKKPNLVALPNTLEEISEIIKIANRDSLAVVPWGGGTKIKLGNLPNKVDVVLCTNKLNQILEHEESDLVATTQCGISLKEFQKSLREKNQTLPIDPPHLEKGATIGGIIATNDSGPKRLRHGTVHGTMRELILGIKVIRPDGNIVKGGAKVVKSVAGYDLPKLFVGSLGTLGIIIEATFRLYPIPKFSQTYLVNFPRLQTAHETVLSILNSALTPTCLELVNLTLSDSISDKLNLDLKKGEFSLAVRLENVEKAVKSHVSKLRDIYSEKSSGSILLEGNSEERFWNEIREFPWIKTENNRTVCKSSVLITDIPKVLELLEELSRKLGAVIYASVRAGNGILIISIEGETSKLIEATASLRDLVGSLKGTILIQQAPQVLKSQIDVWGEIGSSLNIMKKLKSRFDPNSIMNPGRFVGGI
ncbi:FAD-binding oxidoreductase [Desulfobacterota bacterium AH_259_B03_O07]|nr:FAD-binding oxidoreductase [Desulfobacterota bacterium AH_259_B03_O07]